MAVVDELLLGQVRVALDLEERPNALDFIFFFLHYIAERPCVLVQYLVVGRLVLEARLVE